MTTIHREAVSPDRFNRGWYQREMQGHPSYLPERVLFVCDSDGTTCGTASAWRQAPFGEDVGYLHMVAVRPGHTGSRLGGTVSLAVLHRLRSEGVDSVFLLTDDFRLPAIKTYLRLRFVPYIQYSNHSARWDLAYANLGMEPNTT